MRRLLLFVYLAVASGDTTTFLSFSRRVNTCDPTDLPLQEATSKVVWAYNDNDPVNDNSILQHEERGIKSVRFFSEDVMPPMPSDAAYVDIKPINTKVLFNNPSMGPTTQYWCTAYKFEGIFATKKHAIRVEPLIDPRNIANVHHFLIYQCPYLNDTDLAYQGGCQVAGAPVNLRNCHSDQLIGAWAVGGFPQNYPQNIGLPMEGDPFYVVVETHYDNPKQLDIVDSSGMRFWYTGELREYDAGIFPYGVRTDGSFLIPPGQTGYTYKGYCPGECTAANYPPEGINITQVTLHTHLTGRKVFLHHYRNGIELPPIASEPLYDFNYQEFIQIIPNRQVLPGDTLMVECVYDTTDRVNNTKFGLTTEDEMCLAYVLYYPKLPVAKESCSYGNYTGVNNTRGYTNETISCGGLTILGWQPNITVPYVAPTCNYSAPPKPFTTPILSNSGLNKSFYYNSAFLDPNNKYKMYWTVDRENLLVHVGVEVKTTGWVGFGISPNGMQGSDVSIGWVKDGQVHFNDRYAFVKAMPTIDTLQDMYDVSGGEIVTKDGLSTAQIVGISVGASLAGLGLLIFAFVFFTRWQKKQQPYRTLAGGKEYGGTQEGETETGGEPVPL